MDQVKVNFSKYWLVIIGDALNFYASTIDLNIDNCKTIIKCICNLNERINDAIKNNSDDAELWMSFDIDSLTLIENSLRIFMSDGNLLKSNHVHIFTESILIVDIVNQIINLVSGRKK